VCQDARHIVCSGEVLDEPGLDAMLQFLLAAEFLAGPEGFQSSIRLLLVLRGAYNRFQVGIDRGAIVSGIFQSLAERCSRENRR